MKLDLFPTRGSAGNRAADKSRSTAARPRGLVFVRSEATLVVVLVLLALGLRFALALTVPPWQAPDEPKHFEYVRLLVDKRSQLWSERRVLNMDDASPELQQQIIASMAKNHFWEFTGRETPAILPKDFYEIWKGTGTQLHRPSVYYFLAGAALLPFQQWDIDHQLLVLRFLSALLSSLTVVVVYFAARQPRSGDLFVPLVSAALVAALPMHAFIGGAVNNDNLLSLVGSLFFLALGSALPRDSRFALWALIWILIAIGLATKRAFVGLVPLALVATVLRLNCLRSRYLRVGLLVILLLTMAGTVLLITSQLDAIPVMRQLREAVVAYALNEPDQVERLSGISIANAETKVLVTSHLGLFFRSFWGILGWFNLPLSDETYTVIAVGSALSVIGFVVWFAKTLLQGPFSRTAILACTYLFGILSMITLALGERMAYYHPGEIPQGRYMFVAIVPVAVLYSRGLRQLAPRSLVGDKVPLSIVLVLLAVLDITVYFGLVLPFYARG